VIIWVCIPPIISTIPVNMIASSCGDLKVGGAGT